MNEPYTSAPVAHEIQATAERVLRAAEKEPSQKSSVSPEGWEQWVLGESRLCDAWIRKAPAGTSINPHRHPKHRRFVSVLSGTMQMTVGDEELLLGEDQKTVYVPAGTVTSAEIIEKVASIHIFQPPIGEPPVPGR